MTENIQCKCGSHKFYLRKAPIQREFQGVIIIVCCGCGRPYKELIDEFPLGGTS